MALPLIGFGSLLLKMKRLYCAHCDGWSRVCSGARPFARFALGRKGLVSFWAAIAFFVPNATPAATSTGSGIAARYPGDKNIASDPAVIFADDFESYATVDQAKAKWGYGSGLPRMRIATESANVFSGRKSIEFSLPVSTTEISCSLWKVLNPTQDTVYMRMYQKFDAGYNVPTSNHNGIRLSAKYPEVAGQKPPANGTGFFLFLLQNNMIKAGETPPGLTHLYVYWPKQRSQWGDHWYPDGTEVPYSSSIGNKGEWLAYPAQYPDFKPMPNFQPHLNRWYCEELMVHANTPGKKDGEVKFWIDGKVVGDFPDLNLRSISTLKLDHAQLTLHATHSERVNKKWYDNVVIAKQYIGPMASASPIQSSAAAQTLTSPVVQSLKNISTRGMVQTGDGELIGGFTLQGNASKEVVIRGLGPSLTASAVSNALRDPLIELYDSTGALIGSNDNWKTDFNHNSIPVALQPSNDFESALDRVLSPGSYTVILKDAQGQPGVGLFELYDLGGEGSVLENISTRGVVGTGDDVMITGFTLTGDVGSSQKVTVRALGPSLGQFGVRDFLANPSLRVYDSNGILVGQNDNRRDDQAAEIAQTRFAPANDLESGMILTLPPGNYTAILSGVNNTTGNAVVEVSGLN